MRNLKFQRLILYAPREQAARMITFDKDVTVVLGENDTGKSCLLKSIFATFGADAARINPRWIAADADLLLDFTLDDVRYSILRSGSHFAVFNSNGTKMWHETSVVSGLAPKIAHLFNFQLKLQNTKGVMATPPPAFSLLPFYVDQDIGWQHAWSSFANLGMHPRYRQDVAYFHAGLRPNEFYEAKAQLGEAQNRKSELNAELTALHRAAARLQSGRKELKFDLQPGQFGDRLDNLLARCQSLQSQHEVVQHKLSELYSEKAVLEEQVLIVRAALGELDADVEFASDLVDREIVCPTCRTVHHNDFANRYGLISDAEACRAFLLDMQGPLADIDAKIRAERAKLDESAKLIAEITSMLDEERGELKLRDLIEGESERLLDSTIQEETRILLEGIGEQDVACDAAQELMKSYKDKKREKEIHAFYTQKMRTFLSDLNVNLPADSYKRVDSLVKETGSDLPRALLAQYYAFIHTLHAYSTSLLAPIVIDTPIQQDQDASNAKRMIEFALSNIPTGMQLILGTVKLHGANYSGAFVKTDTKDHLLKAAQYEAAGAVIGPFLQKLLAS